jgi:hypothetical protein
MRLVREAPGGHPAFLTLNGIGDQVTLELSPCAASYALTAALHEVLGEHGAAEVESTSLPVAVG